MSDQNISAVLHSKGVLKLEVGRIPEPGAGDVLIAIHSVGVCGSDVHFFRDGAIANIVAEEPLVLGHESSGTVTKIGPGVAHLIPGKCLLITVDVQDKCDRVAIEPGVPCKVCEICKRGKYNVCPKLRFLATPPVDGAMTRYLVYPEEFCFKLPDHMTLEEGAMLEPLSVGIQSCRQSGLALGDKVLVCGAGAIGIMCLMVAKEMGAASVAVTDISASRLEIAKKKGADHTVLAESRDARATAEQVVSVLGGSPDVSIECSGADSSIQTAVYATRPAGVLTLVGLGPALSKVPLTEATVKEIRIETSCRYVNTYPRAMSLVASGRVEVKSLITHHYPLSAALDAFNTAMTGKDGALKVIIDCSSTEGQ